MLKTTLSKQELIVFSLLIREYKGNEIAKKLNLDEKTIGTYKTRIQIKLGLKTIIGMYVYNVKHKISLTDEQLELN